MTDEQFDKLLALQVAARSPEKPASPEKEKMPRWAIGLLVAVAAFFLQEFYSEGKKDRDRITPLEKTSEAALTTVKSLAETVDKLTVETEQSIKDVTVLIGKNSNDLASVKNDIERLKDSQEMLEKKTEGRYTADDARHDADLHQRDREMLQRQITANADALKIRADWMADIERRLLELEYQDPTTP